MTTDSEVQLSELIHAFEHTVSSPAGPTDVRGPNSVTQLPLLINMDETPVPMTIISEVQITQVQSLNLA